MTKATITVTLSGTDFSAIAASDITISSLSGVVQKDLEKLVAKLAEAILGTNTVDFF